MRISRRTRYGVRLMIEIALHYKKEPVSISTIAENEQLSPKFLGQIIIPLKGAGFIQAERGAHGGYSLLKKPEEITIYDIYSVLEGESDIIECVKPDEECERNGVCISRDFWKDLNSTIIEKLSSVSLADLVEQAEKLWGNISPVYQI